jgi:hypothetical protein
VNLGFVDKFHVSIGFSVNRKLVFQSDFCPLPFYFIFFFHHPLLPGKKKAPKGAFPLQALILLSWKHNDPFSLFVFSFVTDSAIDQCEKRKIAAHSDVPSRVNACAELTYQNISGAHGFAAENLYTAPLPLAIASVA